MTRIAIGNDFNVRWSLSQLGQPYNLAGKSITITLKSAYSEQDITDILVSGNVITFMFPAEMQIYIAKYDIILRIDASPDTWTVKLCDAFELVACGSCAYITQDDCNVTTITTDGQTIEFESQIVYPSNGMSAYELAKASGEYTGDYEGYQKWLAGLNGGGGGGGQGGGASTWDELEGKPENLVVAEVTDEEVEEAEGVPNVKYVAQTLTAGQQKQARDNIGGAEATPSGDPMHYAFEAAGAVWDGESWQADQRKGLTNEQVRQLFIKEDMSEMLFRKMWNMAGEGVATRCKYNANTGFYEANGVWHMTYEDALLVYATTYSMKPTYKGLYATRNSIMGMTTIPSIANRPVFGFPPIMWAYKIIDVTFQVDLSDEYWYNSRSVLSPEIGYSPNLRVVRGYFNLYGISNATPIMARANSLLHIYIILSSLSADVTNLANTSIISYASLYTSLNKRSSTNAHTLKLHPTVYGFVTGTINPEELSQEPIRPELADYDLIPYQQNLKVVPDNAFWREELDVKGINGEYVYPSFAEYLANNPSNFATAQEWQALATLAQEKNITLVQG